ncbi:cysteine synthase A [Chitinivibrio alkaliphilus]|uniref:cysteine synthase n=1 Tax=Chitinivibrio alkaliphilus ACht1 TaxID=1313304 RepID=U7D4K8_9BACT|nr:cysteine synthase A [Chitinivibrio alkaliphilus]ERP30868.1 cysteine synthase A [Chitinivibrio alkaliphilus ACht1]
MSSKTSEFRGKIYTNITDAVGATPLVHLQEISRDLPARILGKVESFNPLNSVKCRVAASMIEAAEAAGKLKPQGVVIEPTSGNTGIGLAFICAAKGYRLILTMPETMSIERRKLVQMLGAELVLTPGNEGMVGSVKRAKELGSQIQNAFIPMQFENPANPEVHRRTTAVEIWEDTKGAVDIVVAGVGTGGTITGIGEVLKKKKPSVQMVAVEPDASPVISGGRPGPHRIQGIGAGFIPKNLNRKIIDSVERVTNEDAFAAAQEVTQREGILVGISSGAAVEAARRLASKEENRGRTIVVILPDSGERYISTQLADITA